ncbi:hypothetical protein D3C73_529750 [compost metagenome]
MGMGERNGINARYLAERINVIFGEVAFHCGLVKTGMRHSDDDISTFSLHLRNKFAGCRSNVFGDDLAFQVGFVPVHDLRGHQANKTDLDGLLNAIAVFNFFVQNLVRRKIVYIIRRIVILVIHIHVCIQIGELRKIIRMAISSISCRCYTFQIIQSIVKFMIAKRCRIIAHNIHSRNHRMNLVQLALRISLLRQICAKRCALNQIAVIE